MIVMDVVLKSASTRISEYHNEFWLDITSLPGVASATARTELTNGLTSKRPAGSLASVMVTGYRVIVNEFWTSLNLITIELSWSSSLKT